IEPIADDEHAALGGAVAGTADASVGARPRARIATYQAAAIAIALTATATVDARQAVAVGIPAAMHAVEQWIKHRARGGPRSARDEELRGGVAIDVGDRHRIVVGAGIARARQQDLAGRAVVHAREALVGEDHLELAIAVEVERAHAGLARVPFLN